MLPEQKERLLANGDELLAELGSYVVDVELESGRRRPLVRFFIDRFEGRVTVDDCARASRRLNIWLEESKAVGPDFAIEVSSPGIERRIARLRDYQRFIDHPVHVRLRQVTDGQRNLEAVIVAADERGVLLRVGGREVALSFDNIARANLVHDFAVPEER